jgi:hypothetical protein
LKAKRTEATRRGRLARSIRLWGGPNFDRVSFDRSSTDIDERHLRGAAIPIRLGSSGNP